MAKQDLVPRAVRLALMANAAAAAVIPVAHGQEQPPQAAAEAPDTSAVQEVIVTGTRVSGPGLTSVSPVVSVSPEEIKQNGSTRIEDLLNTLPQVFADQGGSVSNGATGEATVNLRNLGVQRTLVLINGRRLMPGDPAPPQLNGVSAPDLNNIPAALVERVDVLTGGASSTYGADAVAGVVNFVMNDHFEGVKIDSNATAYQHSQHNPLATTVAQSGDALPGNVLDGATKDITIIFGKNLADGTGNFTAYAGYRKVNPILEGSRDFSSCTPQLSSTSATGWTCSGSSTSATGRFIPLNGNGDFTVGPGGAFQPWSGADAYNFAPSNYFQRPDERWTAGSFLHLDINDKVQVYNEFMFMHDTSTAQIAPGGAFIGQGTAVDPTTGIGNGSVQIHCNNPFLSVSELAALCNGSTAGTSQFLLGRRDIEGGDRFNDLEHTAFRAVVGVKGEIIDGWKFDTYFQEGRTEYSNFGGGNFSKSNFANAIDAVPGPTGTPVCANSNALGCVPYNPFSPGGVTQAALNYVDIPTILTGNTEERIYDGNITGDLGKYGVKIPGNDSGLVVNFGTQWRSEDAILHPDAPDVNFDVGGAGSPVAPLSAGFHVWEGYVEGGMPIMTDKPFAKELSIETGYRYSSYNIGFNTNTYKFGVNFAPTSDVRFRGSYQRAVRAPNLQELFTQKVISLEGSFDPCANSSSTGLPNATPAQCARTGVSAAQYGKLIPNSAGQYQGLVGGNPALKPETSDTVSFGMVLTPSFVPNLSMELDYFNIRIKNVITSFGFPLQLSQCLNNGTPFFCNNVHRDSLGSLWISPQGYINDPTLNLGALQSRGVDATANYKWDLGQWGKLNFGLAGTYTLQLQTQVGGPLGVAGYNCAGYFGSTCGVPTPHWKHAFRVNYDTPFAGLGVGVRWRYIGPVSQDVNSPNPLLNTPGAPPPNNIPGFNYFDVTASYEVSKNLSVRVGVNNVLDKDPPLTSVDYFSSAFVNGNTYPEVYDSLGRFLFANLTIQF